MGVFDNSVIFRNNSYNINHYRDCSNIIVLCEDSIFSFLSLGESISLGKDSSFELAYCGCEKEAGMFGVIDESQYMEFIDDFGIVDDCTRVAPTCTFVDNSNRIVISWVKKIKKLNGKRNTICTLVIDLKNCKVVTFKQIPKFSDPRYAANFPHLHVGMVSEHVLQLWLQGGSLHFSISKDAGDTWSKPKAMSKDKVIHLGMNEIRTPHISVSSGGNFLVNTGFKEGVKTYSINPWTLSVMSN
jgi:hypothetical protein